MQHRQQKSNRTSMVMPWPYSLEEKLESHWNVEFDDSLSLCCSLSLCSQFCGVFCCTGPRHNCKEIVVFTAVVLGTAPGEEYLWNGAMGSHMHLMERRWVSERQSNALSCWWLAKHCQKMLEKWRKPRFKFYSPLLRFKLTGLTLSLACPGW